MKKDIEIPVAKDVFVAAVHEWNEEFLSKDWNAYVINNRTTQIDMVLIVSKGYDGERKTSLMRHAIGVVEAKSFQKIELIQEDVLALNNEFFVTYYAGNYIYENDQLQFFRHPEGYVHVENGNYEYVYEYRDHLNNVRLSYTDANNDGDITTNEIVKESNYYPFGLAHKGYNNNVSSLGNSAAKKYMFGGKELDESLGLGTYDFGARNYNPALGRWFVIDALADAPEQIDKSPYQYAWNNPIYYDDPDGNCPNCITGLIGGLIGGAVGGLIEAGTQLYNSGEVTDWSAVGGSAAQGAITGAAAGFTGGASLVVTAGVAGTANAVGGTVNRAVQGQETTIGDVVTDATVGAVLGSGGKAVGNLVKNSADDLSNAAKGKLGEAVTEVKYAAKGFKSQGKSVVPTGGKTPTGKVQVAKYDHSMKNVVTGKKLTVESKFNTSGTTANQRAAASNVTTPGGVIIDRTTSQQLGNAAKAATVGTGAGAAAQTNKRDDY